MHSFVPFSPFFLISRDDLCSYLLYIVCMLCSSSKEERLCRLLRRLNYKSINQSMCKSISYTLARIALCTHAYIAGGLSMDSLFSCCSLSLRLYELMLSFHYSDPPVIVVDMKLSVIILTICVLMDSTSGNCPSSVNCPDGEFRYSHVAI